MSTIGALKTKAKNKSLGNPGQALTNVLTSSRDDFRGRPVLINNDSSINSELSRTIRLPSGQWANLPSIWGGKKHSDYTDDQLLEALNRGDVTATSIHDTVHEAVAAASDRSKALGSIKRKLPKPNIDKLRPPTPIIFTGE